MGTGWGATTASACVGAGDRRAQARCAGQRSHPRRHDRRGQLRHDQPARLSAQTPTSRSSRSATSIKASSTRRSALSGGKARPHRDYRRLLDDREIDAVVISTPEHWHALMCIDACQAGKDVYVEKPASHHIRDGRLMVEAARRNRRVVQVGQPAAIGRALSARGEIRPRRPHRRRSLRGLLESRAPADGRAPVTGGPPPGLDWDLWLGPAPKLPYDQVMNVGRRGSWDFWGGNLTEWGSHLADIVLWAMNVKGPESVVAAGGRFFRKEGEIPDTLQVSYKYPGFLFHYSVLHPQHLRAQRRRRAPRASAASASSFTAPRARCTSIVPASASRRSRCARRSRTSRRPCPPPTAGRPASTTRPRSCPSSPTARSSTGRTCATSSTASRAATGPTPTSRSATPPTPSAGWATSPTALGRASAVGRGQGAHHRRRRGQPPGAGDLPRSMETQRPLIRTRRAPCATDYADRAGALSRPGCSAAGLASCSGCALLGRKRRRRRQHGPVQQAPPVRESLREHARSPI